MKDILEYSREELEALDTDKLLELYHEAEMMEEQKSTGQLTKKVLINSLYGALANVAFILFNEKIAQAITGNGRFFIQKTANMIERALQEKLPSSKKFVCYGDTDSSAPGTLINILKDGKEEQLTIKELYDRGYDELEYKKGKYLKKIDNVDSLSVDTNGKLEYKPIVYIMKHKVKKKMFRITVNGQKVEITGDHSLMVRRGKKIIECKPSDVQNGDKLIAVKEK